MRHLVFVIVVVFFSSIVLANKTTKIDDDFSTEELVVFCDNQSETTNDFEFDSASGGWCCISARTETMSITACSDQGCAAAFAIFNEMVHWE
ncbi:MAG: hypothetical protein ACOCWG_01265 [bacterium]